MTTAEQPIAVAAASSVVGLRRSAGATDWRRQLGLVAGVTAALLGSQTLAASTPLRSDVRLLLPSEGLLAGLGDGLRRGYSVAMEESRSCGVQPPSLQVGWLPPGADPQAPVGAAPRSHLLVAPPAAPLPAYGLLAEQQRLISALEKRLGVNASAVDEESSAAS